MLIWYFLVKIFFAKIGRVKYFQNCFGKNILKLENPLNLEILGEKLYIEVHFSECTLLLLATTPGREEAGEEGIWIWRKRMASVCIKRIMTKNMLNLIFEDSCLFLVINKILSVKSWLTFKTSHHSVLFSQGFVITFNVLIKLISCRKEVKNLKKLTWIFIGFSLPNFAWNLVSLGSDFVLDAYWPQSWVLSTFPMSGCWGQGGDQGPEEGW